MSQTRLKYLLNKAKAKTIVPGQKVKVYTNAKRSKARFGEVIGYTSDYKLLLTERPDFSTLMLTAIHHLRDWNQVIFIQDVDDERKEANHG